MFSLERLYKIFVQNNFGLEKKFGLKKNFGLKRNFGLKKFWVRKNLSLKMFLESIKISGLKLFGPTKIWAWKKILGSKEIFEEKKFGGKIHFGSGNNF